MENSQQKQSGGREFIVELREKLSTTEYMTKEEVGVLFYCIVGLEETFEELYSILRKDILPAVQNNDQRKLLTAFVNYEIRLGYLIDFEYIKMARETLDNVTTKLSDLLPDEETGQSNEK